MSGIKADRLDVTTPLVGGCAALPFDRYTIEEADHERYRAQPKKDNTHPTSSVPLYQLNQSKGLVGGTGEPRELTCSDIEFPWKIKLVSRMMGNLPARFREHYIRMRGSPPYHCMEGELAQFTYWSDS
ncbi:hypothetical protein ACH5RR_032092 [Cinchona calisaya]|uniref:Uncharacterized protein n=1 Tax=Cinchona calisaya TaxID=153742 RepID=A0ABD2YLC3_9GENT